MAIVNPFHDLFVTDSAPAEDFVRYFSPYLVPHTTEFFAEGNVILKGTQGCGKSMLLKLFQPEIRVAYFDLRKAGANELDFPVPEESRNFLGAGVNLSKSGLLDTAQLLSLNPSSVEIQDLTALFADLLNYWLLRDLLKTVKTMLDRQDVFEKLINHDALNIFVRLIKSEDCFFNYLSSIENMEQLTARINERVLSYRKWHARNIRELPDEILTSKTAIGEPLSRAVECLKNAGVIARQVPVFLRIDQMEELWHRDGHQAKLTEQFRRVINRAVGNRDLRVSFRIGTRRYSWDGDLTMPGGRKIEEFRDFVVVDLDQRLRRREDRSGWLFEGFASDVFRHRLQAHFPDSPIGGDKKTALKEFFGPSPTPATLIENLIVSPPSDPKKLLRMDSEWSDEWLAFITSAYNGNITSSVAAQDLGSKQPLSAILAVAWGLQTGGIRSAAPRRNGPPPSKFPPWTKWWEKERLMLAVTQLVVRHQQTLFWWGAERVLSLSASNITLFLSICREVWDQWGRRTSDEAGHQRQLSGRIGWKIQAVAIDNASKSWHRNFASQPGRPGGDVRMRFVDQIGSWLRQQMLNDNAMSYPGGNGFSLRQKDVERYPALEALLAEAVGWGDLYEVDHTTKVAHEKHKNPRKKYYLNPILSPHYQIPDAHTKEPLYVRVEDILKLAEKARALPDAQSQLPLSFT